MDTIFVIIHAKDMDKKSLKYLTLKAERVASLEALSGWLPAWEEKTGKLVKVMILVSDWKTGEAQESEAITRERVAAALAKIGLKVSE